jgi:hypothetical protein
MDVIPYLKEVEHLKVNMMNGVIPSLLQNLNLQEFFVNGSLR